MGGTGRWVIAAVWIAALALAGSAHADPPVGPCDGQQITVAAGPTSAGVGHRAVQLNFTLQPGVGPCQLSGYPTVDAQVDTAGASATSPIHAEQTPSGYLGGASPGTTVVVGSGQDAHAMVEWVDTATPNDPTCPTYGATDTAVSLTVTPPGTSQTFTVPTSVGRNEGLCSLQVHPVTGG